ncbi:hypothetical protein N5A93_13765 [Roseovarius sp. EGI FJ00037]|uniref:hypothetical protein n=1 Tax=Roseovarius salincola TaxID=2978479 RepID=UPI0022A88A6C|nr:hypothetical protein [Roseovarius sp. EGI FJ00037]MCZ0813307.1 hypothetical protein [Roseovarius sp. EGI FJ00037]
MKRIQVPSNYQPATRLERRTSTPDMLVHNRRLGWLLALADRHALLPRAEAKRQARIELAMLLLPDFFPTADLASSYVADLGDLDVALGLLPNDGCHVTAKLPSGSDIDLVTTNPEILSVLGLTVPQTVPHLKNEK